jgi:hypothetical protein
MPKNIKVNITPLVDGKKGHIVTTIQRVPYPMKAEKFIAEDTGNGTDTIIRQIIVDGFPMFHQGRFPRWKRILFKLRLMRKPKMGIPTACFASSVVGNGVAWIIEKDIRVDVEYLKDSRWFGTIIGKVKDGSH